MDLNRWGRGVLNNKQLRELKKKKLIQNSHGTIDGSSLDLCLSDDIWECRSTAKLEKDEKVADIIKNQKKIKLSGTIKILEKEHVIYNSFIRASTI